MNRLLLIIATVLCVPTFTEPIQACQCREYGTPICARFWRSDGVFVGQVVDIRPLKKKPDDVYTYVMVRFMVQVIPGSIWSDSRGRNRNEYNLRYTL